MAEAALQLVGVGVHDPSQVEGEGVAQVMGMQRRDPMSSVEQLGPVSAHLTMVTGTREQMLRITRVRR